MSEVKKYISELNLVLKGLDAVNWDAAGELLYEAYVNNQCVWIAGNGGNLANSMHFATDWTKGVYLYSGKPLRAHSLSENASTVSAYSNDLGFQNQFTNQIRMFAAPNDVVVLLTAGGASENILNVARIASEIGLKTIGLTGGVGKIHGSLFDVHIHIESQNIQLVEDIHSIFGHAMLKFLMEKIPSIGQ